MLCSKNTWIIERAALKNTKLNRRDRRARRDKKQVKGKRLNVRGGNDPLSCNTRMANPPPGVQKSTSALSAFSAGILFLGPGRTLRKGFPLWKTTRGPQRFGRAQRG